MKKLADIFLWIFSIGVLLCLFLGALGFLGFIVAFIIGGDKASHLCIFIQKQFFPWVIIITSVSSGFGLLGMYFKKVKALSIKEEKK